MQVSDSPTIATSSTIGSSTLSRFNSVWSSATTSTPFDSTALRIPSSQLSPPPNAELKNVIGYGMFGLVYRATWTHTNSILTSPSSPSSTSTSTPIQTRVAVKTFKLEERNFETIKKELVIVVRVHHPNIVNVYGLCVEEQNYCIVMEYAENGNLDTLLHGSNNQGQKKLPDFSWSLRLNWLKDCCKGLRHLHTHKPPIIHRDLKPQNVLIRADWRACLCDFGLSVLLDEKRKEMTKGVGTPIYQAPEVRNGEQYSITADIWSIGMLMFELFTRERPYSQDTFLAVQVKLSEGLPPTIPSKKGRLSMKLQPHGYVDLMRKCWRTDPSTRPTCDQIIEEVKQFRMGTPVDIKTESRTTEEVAQMKQQLEDKTTEIKKLEEKVRIIKEKEIDSEERERDEEIKRIKEDHKALKEKLKSLKDQLKEKDQEIMEKNQEIKEKGEKIKIKENEIRERELELKTKEKEYEEKIVQRENEVKERDQELRLKKELLREKEDLVRRHEEKNRLQDERIRFLEETLREKDREIEEREQCIRSKDAVIREKTQSINVKNQELKQKDEDIAGLESVIQDRERELLALKAAKAEKRIEVWNTKEGKSKDHSIGSERLEGEEELESSGAVLMKKAETVQEVTEKPVPEGVRSVPSETTKSETTKSETTKSETTKSETTKSETVELDKKDPKPITSRNKSPEGKATTTKTENVSQITKMDPLGGRSLFSQTSVGGTLSSLFSSLAKMITAHFSLVRQLKVDDPRGIATSESQIYVCDSQNCCIQVFDKKTFAFTTSIGTKGTKDGEFSCPLAIAHHQGRLFIADEIKMIKVFAVSGILNTLFAVEWKPDGIATTKNLLFISHAQENRVCTYTQDGKKLSSIDGGPEHSFHHPLGLACSDDEIFVADSSNRRVEVYNTEGQWMRTIAKETEAPGMISVRGDCVYVADKYSQVRVYKKNGEYIQTIGRKGELGTQIGALWRDNDYLYVSDRDHARVQIFKLQDSSER